MIKQGVNFSDSTEKKKTGFFTTKVESLEPKEKKKKSSAVAPKMHEEKHARRLQLQYSRI